MKIPSNIFQSWYTKDVHPQIQQKIDKIKELNPDYTYTLYTDEEMDEFVHVHYPGEISNAYDKLNIIVAKVDFWRYLILYTYGGVYLDFDSDMHVQLNKFIREDDECILSPEDNPYFFVQWALICNKGHPIMKKTIDLVVQNIEENKHPNDIHKMTGPCVFTEAIDSIHDAQYCTKVPRNIMKTYHLENGCTYRICKTDYRGIFSFKHDQSHLLYEKKKHWREEQNDRNLLSPNT